MLSESVLTPDERSFNQITLYGKDSSVGDVINAARQSPMMGSKMVVIVREAQMLQGVEKLSLYTESPNTSTILIICHKEKSVSKVTKLYKTALKNGVVFESVKARDYEIGGWLSELIRAKGCSIDHKALTMLTDKLGTDISKIVNELTKLFVSLPVGATHISDVDIENNIGISKDFNNFELCKAVVTKNISRSLFIADHFAHNPKDNPLLLTLAALFREFQRIFIFNYLVWLSKYKGQALPSEFDMMKSLQVNSTYAVKETREAAAVWHNRKVFNILGLLREYDAKSKGLNSGNASDGELLRELLMKIFTA
ncbi:MAG: DNA polymerase III subunit delta [Rikenellaceae bacterium]